MKTLEFTSATGISFRVTGPDEGIVTFLDMGYPAVFPNGQVVSQCNLAAFLSRADGSLALQGGVPAWSLTAEEVRTVQQWLNATPLTTAMELAILALNAHLDPYGHDLDPDEKALLEASGREAVETLGLHLHAQPANRILVLGNPIDGLTFHGPFTVGQVDEIFETNAEDYLQSDDQDWHIAVIEPPK